MKNNVIIVDVTQAYGYHFSAANTKVKFMAKGLTEEGDTCTIHNGLVGVDSLKHRAEFIEEGTARVISLPKRGNMLISWLRNIKGFRDDLKRLYVKGHTNTVILGYSDYHIFLVYVILSRYYGYKISIISHEWGLGVESVRWYRKPYVWIYAYTFGYFSDSILPISEYLIEKIKHFKKPYYKLPVLSEYKSKWLVSVEERKPYFVYCGGADYFRVISIMLLGFKNVVENNNEMKFYLILGGTERAIKEVRNFIDEMQMQNDVVVLRNVPYKELLQIYKYSKALMIPLDPTNKQDQARFSQKIAEYLSTSTPIITNSVGEIPFYFTDKENCICCNFSVDGFSEAMCWTISHPEEASKIGVNGFCLGEKEFNYQKHGMGLHQFLISVHEK